MEPEYRPPGVIIAGGALIFIGGFASFVLVLSLLESIQKGGWEAVAITSVPAFFGFVLYGFLPVLTYSSGMALLNLRPWSYKCVVFVLPLLGLFFCLHQVTGQIQQEIFWPEARGIDLMTARPDVFWRAVLQYFLLTGPFLYYFTRPTVYRCFFPPKAAS